MNPQKLIRLAISNIKRISAVEIFPEGNAVVIGGENEQGKSSVLDSIMYALAGGKSIPEQPIKNGRTSGQIVVELDDLVVTRKFTAKGGTSLVVTNKEGSPVASPQALLDKLCGALTFDPMDFSRMCDKEPKKAVETLRQLAGLDFSEVDALRKKIFEERTQVGRELEQQKNILAGIAYEKDAPKEEVSVAALAEELKEIREHNEKVGAADREILGLESKIKSGTEELGRIDEKINDLEKEIRILKDRRENGVAYISGIREKMEKAISERVAPQDESSVLERMRTAESLNAKFRSNKHRAETARLVDEKGAYYEDLTHQIEEIDQKKKDDLAAAKFPTKEISFDESGVLLNGVPFTQGSTAERIRASLAMGMALNPTLRVILIREGSLLDKKSLEVVSEMATANGFQVWIEKVGDGKECQVVISDGMIKED